MIVRICRAVGRNFAPTCAQKGKRLRGGVFQAVASKLENGCGGLQPSELFSPALQFGTDSRRSVTYMKVLASPVASGLLTMPKLDDENTARAGFTGTPLLDSLLVADDTAGMCLGAAYVQRSFCAPFSAETQGLTHPKADRLCEGGILATR